jgi:hypothetical protein
LHRTKTKWDTCNHTAGNIRLNTELVKKPKDLVENVVVHAIKRSSSGTNRLKDSPYYE